MAITGTESRFQNMKVLTEELEVAGVAMALGGTAIGDVTLTGTYATDDPVIEAAINDILAALRTAGIIAT